MRAHKHYLLGLLTVILTFNYVDRLALGLVLQDIKVDLQLTDTELGFLTGMAFAVFYSVMGIPIARWADRGNRVTIISLTAVVWSAAVMLCGMAGSFVQLLSIRVAVAVGEAGCIPPAFSLMADYFSRSERARANAIYGMGGPFALIVGYFLAGWLNEFYGWRVTFVVLGAPGVALAALAWFTLKEPRRLKPPVATSRPPSSDRDSQPTLGEVSVILWSNATFRNALLCLAVMAFFGYGVLQWLPTFFVRSYGMQSGEIGTWLAVTYGLGGFVGTYLGGELASRYAAQNEGLQLKMMALAIALSGLVSVFVYLTSSHYIAFALISIYSLAQATINGPLFAIIQTLVPERIRAVSFALVYLFCNLIGMGLGPLAVGALSDRFAPWAGDESLRYGLLVLAPGYLISAWFVWRGSKTVARDLSRALDEEVSMTTAAAMKGGAM